MYAMTHPNLAVPWENPERVLGQEQRGRVGGSLSSGRAPKSADGAEGGETRVVLETGKYPFCFREGLCMRVLALRASIEVFFELFQLLWHIENSHAVPIEGDLAWFSRQKKVNTKESKSHLNSRN